MKKIIVIFIIFLTFMPFGMNIVWAAGGLELFYWLSRFIINFYLVAFGLGFILASLVSIVSKDKNNTVSWNKRLVMIILGFIALRTGVNGLVIFMGNWAKECANWIECIK